MPNNIILTPNVFCKGVLMNLGGYLSFCRNMTKEYNKEFIGKHVGDTVSVRKPQIFTATTGLLFQPQSLTNIKTNITVGDVTGVHFEWDGVEKTLSIDEAQEKYFKPAAIAMAHRINANAAQYCAQNTYNAVGTPGTTPTLVDTYLAAGDKIVELGLPPEEDLTMIVNRKFSSQYVIGQKALYNEAGTIGSMMRKGEVVDSTLGYTWKRDQTIYTQTVGPQGGTPLSSGGANTSDGGSNGTIALLTKGWTSAAASRLVVGDRFTIATVYSVHPQTKQSTGDLLQFVVLAPFSSDGSGNGSVTVRPGITPTGQYQNVTAAPVDGSAITVLGAAGTASPQAMLIHKNAFAFVSVPLENPPEGTGAKCTMQTDPDTGLSLSLIQFFDGVNRIVGTRFDSLTGFGTLYPEMACAVVG